MKIASDTILLSPYVGLYGTGRSDYEGADPWLTNVLYAILALFPDKSNFHAFVYNNNGLLWIGLEVDG